MNKMQLIGRATIFNLIILLMSLLDGLDAKDDNEQDLLIGASVPNPAIGDNIGTLKFVSYEEENYIRLFLIGVSFRNDNLHIWLQASRNHKDNKYRTSESMVVLRIDMEI